MKELVPKALLIVVAIGILSLVAAVIATLTMTEKEGTTATSNAVLKTGSTESTTKDQDEDNIPDFWEKKHNLDPDKADDAQEDNDSDQLNNLEEYQYDTDPNNPDTDDDGHQDGEEVKNGYNPRGSGKINEESAQ